MAVAVVTDTTQYGPPDVLAKNDIAVVSLYVNDGDTQTRESELGDLGAFFERLRQMSSLPTTSQPSIGDFLTVYEPLAAAGHDIVSVHISGDLSGTAEAARQAAAQLIADHPGRRVEVVDSRSACGGLALIALAGAAAARGGADIDSVLARVVEAQRTTRIWFAIDTLEYLHRGGRVGGAQAWLGGALKIKPILTVDGPITPVERVRTSGRAFERMVGYMHERKADGAGAWAVQHIQAPEQAQKLVERGREIFGSDPQLVSEIGAVIGAHVGPGLLGVAGIPPALLEA
jgi:DegV family protein with EDD domain